MSEPRTGYRQIDHTADVALEIWAPTEAELLATGARAVVAILTDGAEIANADTRALSVEAIDGEDRLVQWLNEIIVAAILDGFLFADIDAIELSSDAEGNARLRASVRGQNDASSEIVTELKSVTYHDLLLRVTERRAECRVVIDV